jgi:hypothetical protein
VSTPRAYWHTWGFRGGVAVRFQPFEHETDARSAVGMSHVAHPQEGIVAGVTNTPEHMGFPYAHRSFS